MKRSRSRCKSISVLPDWHISNTKVAFFVKITLFNTIDRNVGWPVCIQPLSYNSSQNGSSMLNQHIGKTIVAFHGTGPSLRESTFKGSPCIFDELLAKAQYRLKKN